MREAERSASLSAAPPSATASAPPPPTPPPPTFERYAKLWARPLLKLVYDSLLGDPPPAFHYLARDILCLVLSWQRNLSHPPPLPLAPLPLPLLPLLPLPANSVNTPADDILPTTGEEGVRANELRLDLIEKLMGMCSLEETVGGAASTNDLIRENVRIVKLLIEGWSHRVKLRRFIVHAMMRVKPKANDNGGGEGQRGGGNSTATKEVRDKLTAIHLLDVIIQNGLGAADDPNYKPQVRGRGGVMVEYKPITFEQIPKALFSRTGHTATKARQRCA